MPTTSLAVALPGLLVVLFLWLRKSKASPASLPPGPKPLPLVGNITDLSLKELWLPAFQWAQKYGDVVYMHVLGQGLVFLNSSEAAIDLLDKRGLIYSDKPSFVMVGELCGCQNMMAFTSYGDQANRQRRLSHKAFGAPTISSYHPLLLTGTRNFLRCLVVDPTEYAKHARQYAGNLTLSVVYGYEVVSNEDEFMKLGEECVDLLANRISSGGGIWPVDVFPFLKHIPLWMPGSGFKKNAIIWKKKMEEFVDKPFEFVKNSVKSGSYKPSFCSTLLEDKNMKDDDQFDFDLKWTANSMYSGSLDSTITAISSFILAMVLYPAAQQKAQQEIDTVVGRDRLPTFADRASLPFVESLYKETLRWAVPVPLSLPHRLMEDDVYKDMHIPQGSMIFGNIWAMMRNETLYPDAAAFRPERFMERTTPEMERKMNPKNFVFGFGRRQCPGKHLVDSSVWLLIVSTLATLDISKAVDHLGNTVEPVVKYNNAIFRTPEQFQCDIRPRSEKTLSLISQSEFLA